MKRIRIRIRAFNRIRLKKIRKGGIPKVMVWMILAATVIIMVFVFKLILKLKGVI